MNNTVSFDAVSSIFDNIWCGSGETLFHQIAWDCLEKAGLTTYSDEKTYALIHVYAYVIQTLCAEFSYMAYDESFDYDYNLTYEEPLSEAAIGWLYRDLLDTCEDTNQYYGHAAGDMMHGMVNLLRRRVADVLFDQLGTSLLGNLFYFSIHGETLEEEYDEDEEYNEDDDDIGPKIFETKEELLEYCRTMNDEFLFRLSDYNALQTYRWLKDRTYEIGC